MNPTHQLVVSLLRHKINKNFCSITTTPHNMPQTKPKTKEPNHRLVRGSPIYAKATMVLSSLNKVTKIYNSIANNKDVNDTVSELILCKTISRRIMKWIISYYQVRVQIVAKELAINVVVRG